MLISYIYSIYWHMKSSFYECQHLPMDFLGRWCHIAVEVVDGFHTLMVVGIGGVVFECVADMGVVGWCYFGDASVRTEALASAPIGEGSRWCTGAPRVLPFLN
jgi:hypothetical protein